MYSKFRDLKKYTGSDDVLQVEALNWNGEYLDEKIPGFTTLNVDGRENFSRVINAPEMADNGSLYLNSRIEAKAMTVNFQLLANSGKELQSKLDQLKNLLYQPQQKFYFADETQYYYIGTVSRVENSKPGQLDIMGTIEISCSDPFKHGQPITSTNGKTVLSSGNNGKIKSLKFTASATADKVQITTSDGMELIVNRGIEAKQDMTVDFEKLTVKIGLSSALIDLDLRSNLGDFTIKNGTTFTTSPTGTLTIEYEVIQI